MNFGEVNGSSNGAHALTTSSEKLDFESWRVRRASPADPFSGRRAPV
ncbi:hypothetical protein G8767_25595 [Rhodococcus sp. IC4_135]|nr:hypothetical protein [Rhodococcus sp. KBW08]NHP16935.1 hypothetical protein [Rhodococcus sp. IC4_135]